MDCLSEHTGPASDNPGPSLDLGCGVLVPLRHSDLCVVFRYDRHAGSRPSQVEDKPFEAHGIVVTTEGQWEYRGKNGSSVIGRGTTVSGVNGRHFGCRHHPIASDSNLIVALKPNALDEDECIPFGAEVVPFDAEAPLRLAMGKDSVEDFESCIFELLDSYAAVSAALRSRQHGYLRMQRVKRIIERHATEDISLADIADLVNISPFYLLRQFKAHTGATPHDYMMGLRLMRARDLLSEGVLPIGGISRAVGFRDQRYFSRWFLKSTGVSPSGYRSLANW